MGDGSHVPVLTLGVIKLSLKSCSVILNDYHYCPSFILNVISVGHFAKENFEFSIKNDNFYIIMNGVKIMIG